MAPTSARVQGAVKAGWPLALMILLDPDGFGVPGLRRIPMWTRLLALVTALARAISANRRRALLRLQLGDKRVLITGGASGLGLLLARRCVREGAHVVIWDVQPEACARAFDELRRAAPSSAQDVVATTIDVTDRQQVYAEIARIAREVGQLDIVVLNAGIVGGKLLTEASDVAMARTMDVNATSHFWLVKATLPAMLERNAGHIVSIASGAALGGVVGLSDYCASKAAAFTFAETLRMEVRAAGKSVAVTTICPYFIATGMFAGVRTRWSWLLPIYEPDYVAERILEAIKAKDTVVMLPPILHLVPILRGLLPVPAFDAVTDILGLSQSMDSFVGRGGLAQIGLRG
ncbi:hypothetical protein T492DRAFT_1084104 [Pavlovales sp. CCMP2436]|nr:hypothetical protein T492DRAFT_1084104 [Pavlovales sp. CCMP2436]|mmetsp:Transcript_15286/g.38754  ORF Transcript_15286/g.38754 Transcript_15286/m.38754 type:complete len:347 (-) Transcript_15286:205-1245(-)